MKTKNNKIAQRRFRASSLKDLDKLLKKTRDLGRKKGLKPSDVEEAIKEVRNNTI